MLKTVNLVKNYGKKIAVRGVDISVSRGEIVGLLGPNGAGKTTIFYSVTGIIRPTSGKIILGGEDVTAIPLFKRARLGLGYLAQEPSIFRGLTARENLTAVAEFIYKDARAGDEKIDALMEELKKLVTKLKEKNIGILITDHNARDTLKIIDRAYLICGGTILMHGTSRELIDSEKAREIYLGRDFDM